MQDAGFGGGDSAAGGASLFVMLLQTIVALAFVCGLAYFLFRWLLPRLTDARAPFKNIRAPLFSRACARVSRRTHS
jgi:flagellar biogenesis protein FliO